MVLLDEIEKAHPEVFNVLLQVLDDGRLTDGQGRTVDFRNTVFIMTSNIGSQAIIDPKLDDDQKENAVMEALRSHFRPEFLNRVDEIVVYKSLTRDLIANIVKIQLHEVEKRLSEKKITVSYDDKALDYLAKKGFDPIYGARPLKRVIKTELLNRLASEIISGKVQSGDEVKVSANDLGLELEDVASKS